MREELPEADFIDPAEFGWTPERAKIRRMVREFAASIEAEGAESRLLTREEIERCVDPSLPPNTMRINGEVVPLPPPSPTPPGPACDPSEGEVGA